MKKLLLAVAAVLVFALDPAPRGTAWADPSITVTPSVVLSTSTPIQISGTGFTPNTYYNFQANTSPNSYSTCCMYSDPNGNLSYSFSLPYNTQFGSYTVAIYSGYSYGSGSLVTSASLAYVNPSLSVSPNPVGAGSSVSVTGASFPPNAGVTVQSTLNISGGPPQVAYSNVTAGGDGSLSTSLSIPSATMAGQYTVQAYQTGTSAQFAQTPLTVSTAASAAIALSPAVVTAGPNSSVRVTGTAFGPNETVDVQYAQMSASYSVAQKVTSDGTGAFSIALPLNQWVSQGAYTVTAKGETSFASTQAALQVLPYLQPAIVAIPNVVSPGGQLQVTGGNLTPGSVYTLSLSLCCSSASTQAVTADSNGGFTATLTVPNVATGYCCTSINLTGPDGSSVASTSFSVVTPQISIAPTAVPVGSSAYVTGVGFAPNTGLSVSATVELTSGSPEVVYATAMTSPDGSFQANLPIPSGSSLGAYTVYVYAAGTNTLDAQATMTTTAASSSAPSITVSPATATPGKDTSVSVSGSAFSPNESGAVSLNLSGYCCAQSFSFTAGSSGNFNVSVPLPTNTAPGTYSVSAYGNQGGRTASSTLIVLLAEAPRVTASPSIVGSGQSLYIHGSHLSPSTTYTLLANTLPSTVTQSVTTGTDGAFSASLAVPSNTQQGQYDVTLTAQDGTFESSAGFVVSSATVSVAPNPVPGGETVTVTGEGFQANTSIPVWIPVIMPGGQSSQAGTQAQTQSDGSFTVTLRTPQSKPGDYVVDAGPWSGYCFTSCTDLPVVQAPITISAPDTPSINVSQSSVTAGPTAQVHIQGQEFMPGEIVSASYTANLVGGGTQNETAQTTADGATGAFMTSLSVPTNVAGGTYTITATGQTSGDIATAQLIVQAAPPLTVVPASPNVNAGLPASFNGANWQPESCVTLSAAFALASGTSQNVTSGCVYVGSDGTFSSSLSVPSSAASGPVTVTASQNQNGTTVSATTTVNVQSNQGAIQVQPATVTAGNSVTVTGQQFTPNQTVSISIPTSAGTATGQATPGSDGTFSTNIAISINAASTNVTVTAVQTQSGVTATAPLAITANTTPPLTTATATSNSVQYTSGNWTNSSVAISLSSTNAGGPSVASITYSATGAQTMGATTLSGASINLPPIITQGATTVSYYATTVTGTQESAHTFTVNIDEAAPSVSCGSPDGNWHATDVSITCSASDSLSGLANASDGSFNLSTSVTVGTATSNASTGTHQVCDAAGNCATAGSISGIKVDKEAPLISTAATLGSSSTAYTAGSWTNQPVTITFTCTDVGSGLASGSPPAPITVSTEGQNQKASGTCTDNAGNSASSTFSSVDIDRTPPTLSPSISPSPLLLHASGTAQPGASDALSGIAAQHCGAVSTTSVGSASLPCSATDNAGNSATASLSYTVAFGQKLLYNTSTAYAKGSTVRIKLQLVDAKGVNVSSNGTQVTTVAVLSSTGNVVQTLNRKFTYVSGSSYAYALATSKSLASGTYDLQFKVQGDPTMHLALFKIK